MNDIAKEIKSKRAGLTARLHWDSDPQNPRRDYDPLGHLIAWWNRYDLGDAAPAEMGYPTPDDFREYAKSKEMRGALIMPVFVYEHSGITMKVGTGYACPWDSGQAGWVWMTRAEVHKEFGRGPAAFRQARKALTASIREYADYLEGQVYGVTVVNEEGERVESDECWGFIGYDYAQEEARRILAGAIRYQRRARREERRAAAQAEQLAHRSA